MKDEPFGTNMGDWDDLLKTLGKMFYLAEQMRGGLDIQPKGN